MNDRSAPIRICAGKPYVLHTLPVHRTKREQQSFIVEGEPLISREPLE